MHGKGWLLHRLFDHRLEENVEEREPVTTSAGELGRLNIVGSAEIGPHPCWPGDLCLSRSPGDVDAGEFIISVPHVKQLSDAGGKLIIASDGIWDASTSEMAANCFCQAWFLAPSESVSGHAGSIFSTGSKPWQGAVAPFSLFPHKHPHRFLIFLLVCCHIFFLMGCMIISLYLYLH
ncbi:unnamed protein product [Musa acuminata subsp. malaccensis]|uniref:protein-serine/threonine phosphatase n=1 Tax=Musa acuminata subsp. malaccensis TaxID=214687 RepID=A0A804KD53_MUSAM|nr:unnamed protein product [Musa acuminata subsp. malaccensis]